MPSTVTFKRVMALCLFAALFHLCSAQSSLAQSGAMAAGAVAAAKFKQTHQQHSGDDPKTWKSVQRFGLTMRYPADWQLNTAVPKEGPIALNTFESHYSEKGGHFPNHGAEIDISYLPKPAASTRQIMTTDLQESDDQNIDEVPFLIDGTKTLRAAYTDDFQGRLAHHTVVAYVEHGGGLYKFFLTYHKGDELAPDFTKDFEQILKTVRFQ